MYIYSSVLQILCEKRDIDTPLCFCADQNRIYFQDLVDGVFHYTADVKEASLVFLVADDLEVLGREQAQIIVLKIDTEAQKKHAFPALEAHGFRVYDELSGCAFLFKKSKFPF